MRNRRELGRVAAAASGPLRLEVSWKLFAHIMRPCYPIRPGLATRLIALYQRALQTPHWRISWVERAPVPSELEPSLN